MSKYFDLLSKKIKKNDQKEWAIILEKFPDELSKPRTVDMLVELFPLTREEAKDLIESTPIVLLDQLSYEVAGRVKNHFDHFSVSCTLTNDVLLKRKCFRAIWPEPPDLNLFLARTVEDASEPVTPVDLVTEEPVLDLKEGPVDTEFSEKTATPVPVLDSLPENASMLADFDEKRQLRELTLELQRENERLRKQLDQMAGQIRNEEMSKFKSQIEEERRKSQIEFEQLKSDRIKYRELSERASEEKAAQMRRIKELEILLEKKQRELTERENRGPDPQMILLQEKWDRAQADLGKFRDQIEYYKTEYVRSQNDLHMAQTELAQLKSETQQTARFINEARAESDDLKRMLEQTQTNMVQLKEETEKIRQDAESKVTDMARETEEWKQKSKEWSISYANLLKEVELLRHQQNEEFQKLKARNEQLQTQLEQSQQQNRTFLAQLEQQELIQKRMKAQADLAEKEMRLRELLQKRQALEEEIRFSEEAMSSLSSEQGALEEEVLRIKRSQKYLFEQTKAKEKNKFGRTKITNPDIEPDAYEDLRSRSSEF